MCLHSLNNIDPIQRWHTYQTGGIISLCHGESSFCDQMLLSFFGDLLDPERGRGVLCVVFSEADHRSLSLSLYIYIYIYIYMLCLCACTRLCPCDSTHE